jgi:hypothetical protein
MDNIGAILPRHHFYYTGVLSIDVAAVKIVLAMIVVGKGIYDKA